ncbi:WD40/YVTN/BNR-like repeat-containing protein [Paenibacillus allorhizosphaerae]|uniref:Ycf48-like protein n=1 Tax=Paenibacillus allorhizosphaerae TaxID=2849866 RepID=A0ABM8VIR1_9BACL|nr:hypothetical protein [Paenibacillus allorhizosphaerae]CAG7644370.1 Ycf48-like protein [Paenibacillus allorhizosphaerae]
MKKLKKITGVVLLTLALAAAAGCGSNSAPDNAGITGPNAGASPGSSGSQVEAPVPSGSANNNVPPKENGPSGSTNPSNPSDHKVVMSNIASVRLIDPKSGWIGGSGWIARTDDGGKQWKVQYEGKQTVEQLFALNGQEAWAVLGPVSTDAKERRLLHTKDGGTQWSDAGTVPGGGFLHFVSSQEAFAANAYSSDGGKSWITLMVPDHMVGDAYFHDRKNGWVVTGDNNKIAVQRTVDGGTTWKTVMSRESADSLTGAVIRSAGQDDAWVEWIGGSGMSQTSYSLFHTSDGGANWTTVIANSTAGAGPAPGFSLNENSGHKNDGSKPGALYVVSPKVAFMGGYCPACDNPNTVGWTTDGGKTWNNGKEQLPGYGGALLAISDAEHGWLISNDHEQPPVIYTTSDGGRHWVKVHTFDRPAT